jgi:hypothetical protein
MASITLVIPDADLTKVVNALCDGVNPTNAKAKTKIIELAKLYVANYEETIAAQNAQAAYDAARASYDSSRTTARTNVQAISIT